MTHARTDATGVLHLIDTYRTGGPGKTIVNSAKFIDTARFRVHVAAFTPGSTGRTEFAETVTDAGIPFLDLREHRRIDPGHVRQVRRYIRFEGIRIVHGHGYRSDVLGYLAVRGLSNVRLVTTHHGWIRNSIRQRVAAGLALALSGRFDGVAVVSGHLRDEMPGWLKRGGRVVVIHNGIVLEDYRPHGARADVRLRLGVAEGEPLLAVIGRLSVEKGCHEMLDAFGIVARAVPGARLLFVGEGPEHRALASAVSAHGLDDRVQLVGHWSPVQPLYEAADLVVSPSRTEGLSNVILEALAFRRPVVATQVGGNAEIIEDRRTGLLVAPRDPGAMASAILDLLQNPALAESIASAGYDRVCHHFSFQARMRLEEAFYDAVLGRRPLAGVGTA